MSLWWLVLLIPLAAAGLYLLATLVWLRGWIKGWWR